MRSSQFLRLAAEAIDGGYTAAAIPQPVGMRWEPWLVLTLPVCECFDYHAEDIAETRVLRFLLAAEIAESEGD